MENLKFPIGQFNAQDDRWNISKIETLKYFKSHPDLLSTAIKSLTNEQLMTPYRPGGWTICQLVHHIADSHMNAYIRFKLTLTEIDPAIRPYDEGAWAKLPDSNLQLISASISTIKGLHAKWSGLMADLSDEQWKMRYYHPGDETFMPLDVAANMYHWHSAHHLAHIISLMERENW